MSDPPALQASGLHRTFATPAGPVEVLRGVDLTLHRGQMLALLGDSGSGKSTLLQLLGLLDRPTAGSLRIDGQETMDLSRREAATLRSEGIGYIFQAFHLIPHKTAQQNVELSLVYARVLRRERPQRAASALQRVGLGHRLDAMPKTLSGGEQQRVAIARALVRRPRLLLCDEPTGNLDRKNTDNVLVLLRDLAQSSQDLSITVVTHDQRVAAWADRQVHLVDGVAR